MSSVRAHNRFAAERTGLRIRLAILVAAAAMLWDHKNAMAVLIVAATLALFNVVATQVLRSADYYEKFGPRLFTGLRIIDGIFLCGLSFFPSIAQPNPYFLRGDNVWLLALPVLISEAIASRNHKQVWASAAIMAAVHFAALLATKAPISAIIISAGLFAFGALVGVVLASYQSREETLVSRDERLAAVLDCGSALAASADLQATILHTLRSAIGETRATCGYVMLVHEEDRSKLIAEAAFSAHGQFDFPKELQIGLGMSGYVAKMGQPVCISDSEDQEEQFDGFTSGVRSAACVPLTTRSYSGPGQAAVEQIVGVMTLLSLTAKDSFHDEDMELLRTLGALIAVAVSNARAEERRRSTFLRTLESLATALEARDEYTQGHSQRVSEVSLMIGERMGLSMDALEELRVGTILHDIGKIGVPDEILNKKARLTDEEFEIMKSHPVIGYDICKPLLLTEGVLMIIRNHHEKLDGSGYPDGLKGGELPLSLRIVCVADAFDAMSSRRPYRNVMETTYVVSELSRCAGTQFDPDVVESLKELMNSERMHRLYENYWPPLEAKAA